MWFSCIGAVLVNLAVNSCYSIICRTWGRKITEFALCQFLLTECKLNKPSDRQSLCSWHSAFFQGEFPFLSVQPLSPITRQTLRHISSTPPHKAVILWLSREPGEPRTHSLGLGIMRQPFSKWIHVGLHCESEGEFLARLAAFLSLPPSLLPSLPVPSSTTPSHPPWLFYPSLPSSTMAHCGLLCSQAGGCVCVCVEAVSSYYSGLQSFMHSKRWCIGQLPGVKDGFSGGVSVAGGGG